MVINVPMEEFYQKFKEEYDFLYNADCYVAGYDEAVRAGDEFIKNNIGFVAEFAMYRGDILLSDREIAAFMFALNDYLD